MNSIYFFYNIFSLQELILKFNNKNLSNLVIIDKFVLFKPQPKDSENNLNIVSNDLRYIFEFLTNTKVIKSFNNKFICFTKLSNYQSLNVLLYLSYLIFSKFTLTLENINFDLNFPVIQYIQNSITIGKTKNDKNFKCYFDIKFNSGLDFVFLSDNEYLSYLAIEFYIRIIYKKKKNKILFFFYRQLMFLSLIGQKYFLLYKKK